MKGRYKLNKYKDISRYYLLKRLEFSSVTGGSLLNEGQVVWKTLTLTSNHMAIDALIIIQILKQIFFQLTE